MVAWKNFYISANLGDGYNKERKFLKTVSNIHDDHFRFDIVCLPCQSNIHLTSHVINQIHANGFLPWVVFFVALSLLL